MKFRPAAYRGEGFDGCAAIPSAITIHSNVGEGHLRHRLLLQSPQACHSRTCSMQCMRLRIASRQTGAICIGLKWRLALPVLDGQRHPFPETDARVRGLLMPPIGFSTGALFQGDVGRGVTFSRELQTDAIELSALRVRELDDLIRFTDTADLSAFRYVSAHAPTDFSADEEAAVANRLRGLAERHHWFVVVHPDTIRRSELWRSLGRWLCRENMDKRKPVGRTMEELSEHRQPDPQRCARDPRVSRQT